MGVAWFCNVIILAFSGITLSHADKWSYSGDSGTAYWHEVFPEACAGKHQSPIDIRPEETIYNPHLKDFAIWYDPPKPDSKMYIKNNGHTVQVDLEGDFYVTNGGLSHVYKALQFHFHWGHKENLGSEHLIDGEAFPIEMHLVTYNEELFSRIGEAVMTQGGLAVLGVMYEISDEDNPDLAPIVRALKHVRDPEKYDKVALPLMSLRDFLPKDISRYYRYNGSLTTPGCFESVIWTLFDEKQTISLAQLREFTKLLQSKHLHRKNKKGDGHTESRHRRSLNKAERKLERRAKHVLDELGIRGNHNEEEALKSDLVYMAMMADMPEDDEAVVVKTESLEEDEEVDKTKSEHADGDSTDNEKNNDDHEENDATNRDKTGYVHKENGATENEEPVTDDKHHGTDHTAEEKEPEVDFEEHEYIQEAMVNNFRPVQPLNDRIVYRSFKLKTPVVVDEDGEPQIPASHSAQSTRDNDNGTTFNKLSVPAIVTMIILTLIFT